MNCQFLFFQSLGIFLIASSTYGDPLPENVKSRYTYCFELRLIKSDAPVSPHLKSFDIDNLCKESNGTTFHFLSSAQKELVPIISASKSEMTCVILDFITLGIKLKWPARDDVNLLLHFQEKENVLRVYDDIHYFRPFTREALTIGCIQKLLLKRDNNEDIVHLEVLTQRAGLYTELYQNTRLIFSLRGEGVNGLVRSPVLIFLAGGFNISNVLVNNNVVIRYHREYPLYHILTFHNHQEAKLFRSTLLVHADRSLPIIIPSTVYEILRETRV